MVLRVSNQALVPADTDLNAVVTAHSSEESDESNDQVEVFRALSDPIRLEMVKMMSQHEVACTAFIERFHVTKSTISYHVRVLKSAHLVRIRREGPWYFYRLTPGGFDSVGDLVELLVRVDPATGPQM